MITLTIPNDDHIALRAFGKALEEMALAHGAEPVQFRTHCNVTMNDELNDQLRQKLKNVLGEPRDGDIDVTRAMVEQCAPIIDTTAQQVESLASIKPFEERLELLDKALSKETPESLAEKLQSYNPEPTTTDSTGTPWDERIHSASKALNADGTWRLRRKPKDMGELEWSDYVSMIKADLQYPVECGGEGEEIGEPTREEVDELIEASNKMLEPPVTHQNPVYMYQESRNVYALGRSEEEIAEYEAKGYVRHTQEQYDAWEGPMVADEGDDFYTDAGVVTEQTVAGIPPIPVPPPVVVAPPVPEFDDGVPFPPSGTVSPALERMTDRSVWDFPRLMTFLTERHGKIDVATVNTLLAQDGVLSVQELNAHPDKIGPFVARVKAHLGE